MPDTLKNYIHENIADNNRILLKMLMQMRDAIALFRIEDNSLKFLMINSDFESIVNIEPKELIDKDLNDVDIDEELKDIFGKCIPSEFEYYNKEQYKYYKIKNFYPSDTTIAFVFNDITDLKRQEREIERAKDFYFTLFEKSPAMIWKSDKSAKCTYFNDTWLNFTGRSLEQELGDGWAEGVHPKDLKKCIKIYLDSFKERKPFSMRYRLKNAKGEYRWILDLGRPFYDIDEEFNGFLGSCYDVTEQKEQLDNLKLLSCVFENSSQGVVITDSKTNILAVNEAFSDITLYSENELLSHTPKILKSNKHNREFYSKMWEELATKGKWQGEIYNRKKNGDVYLEWLTISAIKNSKGKVKNYVALINDITKIKEAEDQLSFLAYHDTLTGLPNRKLFRRKLREAIERAKDSKIAVLFIDLDNFKNVNDTLGHPIGDVLLKKVAKKILCELDSDESMARLGGDEFIILMDNIKSIEAVVEKANDLTHLLCESVFVDKNELSVSASIGVSIYPDDGKDIDTLIKNSDLAMYQAKAKGKNSFEFYKQEMSKDIIERLSIEQELRKAIDNDEFELYYQPQVDMDNKKLTGAEALIRWNHPKKGLVSPAKFIPVAEESGLIVEIGEWVVKKACKELREFKDKGLELPHLSINLSVRQIEKSDITAIVNKHLKLNNLPPQSLELEITESIIMTKKTNSTINKLKDLGVLLSIDDFGTGYSSLSYLKNLPIYKLKIDKSFVQDLQTDDNDKAITKAIIALSKTMGLKVIAEGVEEKEQEEFLKEQGCFEAQGYLYSKPVCKKELLKIWNL